MDSNRGKTINTEKEIYDYIKSNETNGALLIKGKWGSGKTFLINSIIEKEKDITSLLTFLYLVYLM